MTIYEIPNIEHCDIKPISTLGYSISAHEGWYIHLNDDVEDTINIWKRVVVLLTNTDWSIVEIRHESELPHNAEI